jgi:flavin-binding protein dodecin
MKPYRGELLDMREAAAADAMAARRLRIRQDEERAMSVAKVTEIIAQSPNSFDEAVKNGIERASRTLKNVQTAWVQNQTVTVENGQVTEYRVNLKVTFVLDD